MKIIYEFALFEGSIVINKIGLIVMCDHAGTQAGSTAYICHRSQGNNEQEDIECV